MKQTRISSLVEALLNVLIGYVIAVISQALIFPWFGIYVSIGTNMLIGLWFTVISIVRMYVVRRWFDARLHKVALLVQKKEKSDGR